MNPRSYLLGLEQLGIKFGLENILALAEALDAPQDRYRSVIIAGTNGKGSVAAMVERGLRAAGFKTGLYTSPHLVRLEERVAIDGSPVDPADLDAAAVRVQQAAARLRLDGRLKTEPTFFEAVTAAAFEVFRAAGVDVAVLEVGMGGRLDATNIATPEAAAITTVDFDHQAFLGHTLAEIAFEKAGVIKPGTTVVSGALPPDALAVVRKVAERVQARLVPAFDGVRADARLGDDGRTLLDLETPTGSYGTMSLALRGLHQVANAVVAIRLLEELGARGEAIPREAARLAVTDAEWRGRLQVVPLAGGCLLLDGAHNPAGASVLADYLAAVHPGGLPIVFGVMRDKDVPGILSRILPHATALVATSAGTARAADPAAIAAIARRLAGAPAEVVPDVVDAVVRAQALGPEVCVAGSLYLVGAVLDAVERGALG